MSKLNVDCHYSQYENSPFRRHEEWLLAELRRYLESQPTLSTGNLLLIFELMKETTYGAEASVRLAGDFNGESVQIDAGAKRVTAWFFTAGAVAPLAGLIGGVAFRDLPFVVGGALGGAIGAAIIAVIAAVITAIRGTKLNSGLMERCVAQGLSELIMKIEARFGDPSKTADVRWTRRSRLRWLAALTAYAVPLFWSLTPLAPSRAWLSCATWGFIWAAIAFLLTYVLGLLSMPNSFYQSDPTGRRLLARSGVTSITGLRILCAIFSLVLSFGAYAFVTFVVNDYR